MFQRIMDTGISNVAVYLDDILISGSDEQDHLLTLANVLQKLESAGLTLKRASASSE